MKKLSIVELRNQLAELKKAETIAQTREQVLNEEKQNLLSEISTLFSELEKYNLFSKEELVPNNLQNVANKLYSYVESEIVESKIPQELL